MGLAYAGPGRWAVALILTPVTAAYAKVVSWWTAAAALLGTVLYLLFAISPLPVNRRGRS